MKGTQVISVSRLNGYIKNLMDTDRLLSAVLVRGEISNYKAYPSGHHYFSLKDAEGTVRCVLFRREAASLRFRPQNGMQVIAAGRVTVFPRDGQYQLYCTALTPDGAGDLAVAFEQLKKKLEGEGLFDPAHKRPLPRYPKKIALITSPAGAAVRDMLRILGDRWPMAEVVILPVRVQGQEAAGEICAALELTNRKKLADLIITGRGGGSLEDLWAFNEEPVARAVFASKIPVISAVGHEPDVTIIDYVADLRAATPSNAAELAVPDRREQAARLRQLEGRLGAATARKLQQARGNLTRLARSRALRDPMDYLQHKRLLLDHQEKRLAHGLTARMGRTREQFARLAAKLDALSPLKVLGRGYAIAAEEEGAVLRSIGQARLGMRVTVRLADGSLGCRVEDRKED